MAQISVDIKYLLNRNGHVTVETVKAKVDTSARVDEFLQALKESIKELGKGNQQLFLSADPEERLDNLGIREGDTIVVMTKNSGQIVVIETQNK